jgi:hypothetical protein
MSVLRAISAASPVQMWFAIYIDVQMFTRGHGQCGKFPVSAYDQSAMEFIAENSIPMPPNVLNDQQFSVDPWCQAIVALRHRDKKLGVGFN